MMRNRDGKNGGAQSSIQRGMSKDWQYSAWVSGAPSNKCDLASEVIGRVPNFYRGQGSLHDKRAATREPFSLGGHTWYVSCGSKASRNVCPLPGKNGRSQARWPPRGTPAPAEDSA